MRVSKKNILLFSVITILFFVISDSCTKDPPAPHNPYDDIHNPTVTPPTPPDPNSIVGIHANILKTRCAKSGCHEGHFEPDFRKIGRAHV